MCKIIIKQGLKADNEIIILNKFCMNLENNSR